MDYFYDGQIRRYVTQFMRVFIGFKYKTGDDTLRSVPVMYGDMTRQVASIIRENSENKLPSVPRIACYITGLEQDMSRMSDPSFVSKVNIRQRSYEFNEAGEVEYGTNQGGYYTVERLLPTPYKLKMKADIWTSNTDQKLQIMEQIAVLFHPSLEIQTNDNYIDWTSLTVIDLDNINFSSRTIPQGAESEIDIASMDFTIPIYISPPAKVKKLGIVKSIVANIFTEQGDLIDLETLAFNQERGNAVWHSGRYRIMMFKSQNGQPHDYDITLVDPGATVKILKIPEKDIKIGGRLTWNQVLDVEGGYTASSRIFFKQPSGNEISGTFAVNPLDPTVMVVTFDQDTYPGNNLIDNNGFLADETGFNSSSARGTVDAIIDPYKFNPLTKSGGRDPDVRYLMLDDVNPDNANQDGPDAWKNLDGSDPVIKANSIIRWTGSNWATIFDPDERIDSDIVIQNMRTLIKYRWVNGQWLKAFEGEYAPGYWRFDLDA